MDILEPKQIVDQLAAQKQQELDTQATQSFHGGLFLSLKLSLAQMFSTALTTLTGHTYNVQVANQLQLPEVQKISGEVSLKDLRVLVLGLNEVVKGLKAVSETNTKNTSTLSKELKPTKVDFSALEKAIKAIDIPETIIPEQPTSITVNNLDELKKPLAELASKLRNEQPIINIPPSPKSVTVSNLEPIETTLGGLLDKIQLLVDKPDTEPDLKPLISAVKKVQDAIDDLVFPVPNFSFPKNNNGSVMVGTVELDVTARYDIQGTTVYEGEAPQGSSESAAVWRVVKYDLANLAAASGKLAKGITWAGRTGASYG